MRTVVRDRDWWAYLFRVTHRERIPGIAEWDARLLDFLVEMLGLEPGSRVLDVACGSGVHLTGLARRGIGGVGLDLAPSLVAHATEQARRVGVADLVRFVEGDMRDLGAALGDEEFDAVTLLSGSFGFFDEETNRAVLDGMAARLGSGGRLLLDCCSPSGDAVRPGRSWDELDGGILLFTGRWDPVTCTRVGEHAFVDADGVRNVPEEPERIRVYGLPELREMLARANLSFEGGFASHDLPPVPYGERRHDRLVVIGRR